MMRKVDNVGQISFLNENWSVGSKWIGEYVRATINTAQHSVTFWHQAERRRLAFDQNASIPIERKCS